MKEVLLKLWNDAAIAMGILGVIATSAQSVWEPTPDWLRITAPIVVAAATYWKQDLDGDGIPG